MPKSTITEHERKKILNKMVDVRYPPQRRAENAGRLARLVMKRHGFSTRTHEVRMPEGVIVERGA